MNGVRAGAIRRARGLLRWAKDRTAAVLRDRWADGRIRAEVVHGRPAQAGEPEGLPVLMCAWARVERIDEVLATLDAQVDAPPVDLWIWNNRRDSQQALVEGIRRAAPTGAIRSVRVVRSAYNAGSIARFYVARHLWLQGRRGPFVVVDDDQRLPVDFLATAVAEFEPGTAKGVWAFRVGDEYWDRQRAQPGDRVDHLGPGGMVADLAVVAERSFFDDLPLEHWHMDDLWFSHYAPRHGVRLGRLGSDVVFADDDHNIYLGLAEQKVAFHRWLRAR